MYYNHTDIIDKTVSMICKAYIKLPGFLCFQSGNYWKYLNFNNKHRASALMQFKDNVHLHANSYLII